ncbi:WYL domain-containing protein [Photobacterium swingsii]|uniref:WYL domain-containing protein n=1 Tax=Photobacterium swingsii TaxID=680026 RepID=UPI00352EE4D5
MSSGIERNLYCIDFYLAYCGQISRTDLMEFAQISVATASRTLSEYTRRWPHNLTYKRSEKLYVAELDFVPAFSHDPLAGLDFLATGLIKRHIPSPLSSANLTAGISLTLNPELIRMLTSAACRGSAVTVQYVSLQSGTRERLIAPTQFFSSMGNWYCRAFDFSSSEFRVFRISRFKQVLNTVSLPSPLPMDNEWLTEVVLTLVPHPNHQQPEAIRLDLGLENKPVLNLRVSAALAGYCLQEWRVDCSANAGLPAAQFPLHLANRYELTTVYSMCLAPGFSSP